MMLSSHASASLIQTILISENADGSGAVIGTGEVEFPNSAGSTDGGDATNRFFLTMLGPDTGATDPIDEPGLIYDLGDVEFATWQVFDDWTVDIDNFQIVAQIFDGSLTHKITLGKGPGGGGQYEQNVVTLSSSDGSTVVGGPIGFVTLTPVHTDLPEPGTLWMLLLGFTVIAYVRWSIPK